MELGEFGAVKESPGEFEYGQELFTGFRNCTSVVAFARVYVTRMQISDPATRAKTFNEVVRLEVRLRVRRDGT